MTVWASRRRPFQTSRGLAPLALAGAGATPQLASAAGARLMAGNPVTEAEQAGWSR